MQNERREITRTHSTNGIRAEEDTAAGVIHYKNIFLFFYGDLGRKYVVIKKKEMKFLVIDGNLAQYRHFKWIGLKIWLYIFRFFVACDIF